MRIAFVGSVRFSDHCLREVVKQGEHVVAVLTQSPEHSGFHSDYFDLGETARRYRIPVHYIRNINDPEVVDLLKRLAPDLIFVFGFSQLIKLEILTLPSVGCIGTHPALLPKHRGRHPLIWTLVEGLDESGLTFFYMDEGADSGDILWQRSFPVTLDDDAASLYEKIENLASDAIAEFLPQLRSGTAPRSPQDNAEATYWRKRGVEDGELDWTASTIGLYNLIRALTRPYPGAHTFVNGVPLTVWSASLPQEPLPAEAESVSPGTVFRRSKDGWDVRTIDGYLILREIETPTETDMDGVIHLDSNR